MQLPSFARGFCALVLSAFTATAGFTQNIYYAHVKFDPSVPAVLRAYEHEELETKLLGYTPWLNRITVGEPDSQGVRLLTATFNNAGMVTNFATPPPTYSGPFRIPGLPAGTYTLDVRYPNSTDGDRRTLIVEPKGSKVTVNSYCENGSFFCMFDVAGKGRSLVGQAAYDVESDSSFKAWSTATPPPSSAVALYRLRLPTGGSPFIFYTTRTGEVSALKSVGFVDDGVAFHVLPEQAGSCPAHSQPIYRVFSGGGSGPAHRYTPDPTAYRQWTQHGFCRNVVGDWACAAEGIAFCAPL